MSNQALWLDKAASPFRLAQSDMPTPGPDEVVIKNQAYAINPIDWKMQDKGYYIQSFPAIIGCDVAGEVAEVGDNVTRFKKGDRVIAACTVLAGSPVYGAFQLYTAVPTRVVARLPDSVSYTDGSVLPLALNTAATGLYRTREDGFLGLDFPSLNPKDSGKTVVVYGASSSVGALAVQLASASGAYVIAIASERNFQLCREAGAREVLDYKKSSIVDDIVAAVKASPGEFVGVLDAIAMEDSFAIEVPALEKLGGGILSSVLPPPQDLPASIKPGFILAGHEKADHVWANYVTPALEQGKLKSLPPANVVSKGLEGIQKGIDANRKGVSGIKIVVEL